MSKKVLIIEDDHNLSDMYCEKFKMEGFNAFVEGDGQKGISTAKEIKPDVILLDILLSTFDGFEVLKGLKSMEETKNAPVLILSNVAEGEEVNKGLALGAKKYLVKAEYTPAEVVDEVKKLLE